MTTLLANQWLSFLLLALALICLIPPRSAARWLLCAAFVLLGFSGWLLPAKIGQYVLFAALGGLTLQMVFLILTGNWSATTAWLLGAAFLVGLGSITVAPTGAFLRDLGRSILQIELLYPQWLLLLIVLPLFFIVGARNLGLTQLSPEEKAKAKAILWKLLIPPWGLYHLIGFLRERSTKVPGLTRRWIGVTLRCLLVLFLAIALAEPRIPRAHRSTTVIFVLDRSLSVPVERDADREQDQRWERVRKFLNDAVAKRPLGHERDRAGLVVFGRRPRLELLPTDAPRFNLTEITSPLDRHYTDIGAAIQLALASFPEDTAKRIVLISDGNENRGNALEQAQLARTNGAEIDVLPLAEDQRQVNEVLVERIQAPRQVEQGAQVPLTVWVRSFSPDPVVGILSVEQISRKDRSPVVGSPRRAKLELGLNRFTFQQPVLSRQESYTYEARFLPEAVLKNGKGTKLVGDRPQNNRATTHVIARGQRRVLLLEREAGEQTMLAERLRQVAKGKMQIIRRPVDDLTQLQDRERLTAFLSNFDCLILANVPAEKISEQQQEVIRSNTHDQGCGLVMIGGPDSFGAGGWQNTPVEKALPVDAQIKGIEVAHKSGLVLIMHACEMAQGNYWEKKIARLAIDRLGPGDEVGVLAYDFNMKWHIPLQPVADNRPNLLRKVDRLTPGDMPAFDPGIEMAYKALTDPEKDLATKHIIIITDGDPQLSNPGLLAKCKNAKVTITTVGVATHDQPTAGRLKRIARATGGRTYLPKSPRALPAIYIRETRQVSQAFVYKKRFLPQLIDTRGPAQGLPLPLPPLGGFVRTTPKGDNGVTVAIRSPKQAEHHFPILAYWRYGLGGAVAFTSDSGPTQMWCEPWSEKPLYGRFWEQILDWSMRPVESEELTMRTYYHDGQIRVIVTARDKEGNPDVSLTDLRAEVTLPRGEKPGGRKPQLRFEQKSSGLYEATFPAEESGSWFIALHVTRRALENGKEKEWKESIRSSVTIPYAPEFADMESNSELMERIRQETGGERYVDDEEALAKFAASGVVFRAPPGGYTNLQPIWYWLLFITAGLLVIDVAVRRIAFERLQLAQPARHLWNYLRYRSRPEDESPLYLERLKSRKAQVGEELTRTKAEAKFEAGEESTEAPAGATAEESAPPPAPTAPPAQAKPSTTDDEEGTGDFASRLLKAKKKIWEERDQDKGKK